VGFAHIHKLFKKSLNKNFIENRTLCGFLEKTIIIIQLRATKDGVWGLVPSGVWGGAPWFSFEIRMTHYPIEIS